MIVVRFILVILLFILSSCGENLSLKYKVYSHGGDSGNTSSIVTISGYVISNTSYVSSSSLLAGLESTDFARFTSAMTSAPPPLSGIETVNDACSGAEWDLFYVGEGDTVVGHGTANADGSFDVPTVPEGKEGVVVFDCSGSQQRCLAKAGDSGLLCNAVADGVIGALEASLGSNLSDNEFKGKNIAKLANSIVESTKTDSSDSDTLKTAITDCKALTDLSAKKTCYKNAMDASSMSGTLEVVKTLAQTWRVRGLFNFVAVTAGIDINLDGMLYTPFGTAMDSWFGTDFVSETKAYIQDLINNPDYINGDVSQGDQVVKIMCKASYSKFGSGGITFFKPTVATNSYGVANVPSCLNLTELANIKGSALSAPQITYLTQMFNQGSHGNIQLGVPGDANGNGIIDGGESYVDFNSDNDGNPATGQEQNCSNNGGWQTPGYLCIWMPEISITSKVKEPNRNDVTGMNNLRSDTYHGINVIEVFSDVQSVAHEMNLTSMSPASVQYNPTYAGCFSEASGPGIDLSRPVCENWVSSIFVPMKKSFAGMMGLYMYLKDPSSYASGGSAKLSLDDIHRIFSKSDFFNVKLTAWSPEYNYKSANGVPGSPPIIDVTGSTAKMQQAYHYSSNPSANDLQTANANGSLVDHYSLTFEMFENIPTSSVIQSYVMAASHHEEWNPYGEKYRFVPGVTISGTDYPIYCRMLNRSRVDGSGNFLPMEKELNTSSKIQCLANPVASGVTLSGSVDGLYNVPSTLAYPYVLQERGWMGDSKGKLFSLADRKTGMEVRVGNKEIYILENKAGNNTLVVATPAGISCNGGAVTDSNTLNSAAPLVKAKVNYGQGGDTKNEVVDAYCLNMSSLLISDTSARYYYGGDVSITYNNNGTFYTYSQPQVGGMNTSSTSTTVDPICLFTDSTFISVNQATGEASIGVGYSGNVTTANYTDPWEGIKPMITTWNNGVVTPSVAVVDRCDGSHPGMTKYYITHHYDNITYDATNSTSRNSMPAKLVKSDDSSVIRGIYFSLGAIEAKYSGTGTISVANSSGITWYPRVKMLNTRHNAKFDPYCDDTNGNGYCDCYDASTLALKDNPIECNLLDTAAEPTISSAPYNPQSGNRAVFETFFNTFGNLAGTQLVDGGTSLGAIYFNNNQLYMRMDDVLTCAYHLAGETNFRRPSQIVWNDFSNLHFPGCPASENATTVAAVSWSGQNPSSGGGPVRIIKPMPMNNAYDVEKPKTMLNMMNYATKTVGQGIEVGRYEKVFTFDEALALVALRTLLPPQAIEIYEPDGTTLLPNAFPGYSPVRASEQSDMSAVSAILKGLVQPEALAQ